MKKLWIIILSLQIITAVQAQTPSKIAGSASLLFLRSGLSARVSGLGDTFTAISDDENALYFNPAGLANIRQGSIGLNHTQWFEDIRMDNIVAGYNFDRKLGVALGVSHLWMPSIEGKNAIGISTGNIDVSSSIIHLGLGYKIDPSFFVGLGVKYFRDDLAGVVTNGIALDAGIFMYLFIPGLTFGASVQNIGGDVQYDSKKEKIPFVMRTGLAYKVRNTGLRIAIDGIKSIDSDLIIGGGIEYTFMKTFSLRFGNQFRQDMGFSPGYGAGINLDQQYLIDYTFHAFEDLGNTHRVGFTFRFDLPSAKIRSYSNRYKSYSIKKSRPPQNIRLDLTEDRTRIKWDLVPGAVYNVYAKTSAKASWKKINSSLIRNTFYEFKKPSKSSKAIFICITSIVNSVESAFSKEIKIDANH